MSKKRHNDARGFTLVELMISMVVFMISVIGLIGMQKASIEAARRAKDQTAAYNISRFVMTQLKTEFANWRRDEAATPANGFPLLGEALKIDPGTSANGVGIWLRYGVNVTTGADNGDFRLDEYLGHSELSENMGASRFCVAYSVSPMFAGGTLDKQNVWMVRVRTTWTKAGYYAPIGGNAWHNCSEAAVQARLDPAMAVDHVVELVTMATREFAL